MDLPRCELYDHCPLLAIGATCMDRCYALDRHYVTDTVGRIVAPPQSEPAPRPDGPWRENGK